MGGARARWPSRASLACSGVVLKAFFRRERGFFLSGGGALAGFYLGHRETHDLDLFTVEAILDRGAIALREVADELGATLERLQTSPDFQRWLVRRGEEGIVVDLVHERVPQLHGAKRNAGAVLVDPPEEILANKLCALLSRAEIRDLVDLMALSGPGIAWRTRSPVPIARTAVSRRPNSAGCCVGSRSGTRRSSQAV